MRLSLVERATKAAADSRYRYVELGMNWIRGKT